MNRTYYFALGLMGAALLVACGDGDDQGEGLNASYSLLSPDDLDACEGPKKIALCHIPPGNPDNRHPICISVNAAETHQTRHGDYPATAEDCADGVDNDCDGHVDADDPDCAAPEPEVCDDGADNDLDGLVDCEDEDCAGVGDCPCPEGTLEENDVCYELTACVQATSCNPGPDFCCEPVACRTLGDAIATGQCPRDAAGNILPNCFNCCYANCL